MESNQLFRKESLDHFSSSEQVHDYLCMTSPKLWMLLAAIAALLIGLTVFTLTGARETIQPERIEIIDGYAYLTMDISLKNIVSPGMRARVGGQETKLEYVFEMTDYNGHPSLNAIAQANLPNGEYDGEILISTRTPIQMLLNGSGG